MSEQYLTIRFAYLGLWANVSFQAHTKNVLGKVSYSPYTLNMYHLPMVLGQVEYKWI